VLAALVLLNLAVWVLAAFALSAAQPVEIRLARYAGGAAGMAIVAELTGSPISRLLRTLAVAMRRRARRKAQWSPAELTSAGIDLARVDAARVLTAGTAAALGVLPGLAARQSLLVLFGSAAAGIAWIAPSFWVGFHLSERRRQVLRTLPDTLDLMAVAMSAGQGLDQAIALVAEGRADPLSELLRGIQQEIRLGRARAEALRSLGERSGLVEVQELAGHLVRSATHGTSLAETLRVEAAHMRALIRQKTREKAGQAAVKLLFPLVAFFVPVLFLITIGPIVLRVIQTGIFGGN